MSEEIKEPPVEQETQAEEAEGDDEYVEELASVSAVGPLV